MAKITDLTGYTVTVPSGWTASAGYGEFKVDLTLTDDYGYYSYSDFYIGYKLDRGAGAVVGASNYIYVGGGYSFDNSVSIIATFTGGDDVNKPNLIQWLYDNNATFTKEGGDEPEQPEQPTTPTKKFTRLYIGEIVKTIGNKVFRKLQTTAPIKFTIGGTEYQAEPSMTFGEWLESGYNTSDYYTKTITSGGVEYNPIIIAEDGDVFTVVETKGAIIEVGTPITADAEYTTVILTQDGALPVWNGTDLTGTTWLFDEKIESSEGLSSSYYSHDLDYQYNGIPCWYFGVKSDLSYIRYYPNSMKGKSPSYKTVYTKTNGWGDEQYRTITINENPPSSSLQSSLCAWLKANATLTSHTMA